jgi:hypothetical protein
VTGRHGAGCVRRIVPETQLASRTRIKKFDLKALINAKPNALTEISFLVLPFLEPRGPAVKDGVSGTILQAEVY